MGIRWKLLSCEYKKDQQDSDGNKYDCVCFAMQNFGDGRIYSLVITVPGEMDSMAIYSTLRAAETFTANGLGLPLPEGVVNLTADDLKKGMN